MINHSKSLALSIQYSRLQTIRADLIARGISLSLYAIRLIMADNQLITRYRRKHKRTTTPDPDADYRADLLERKFTPAVPTTYLCGDITYLRTAQGWMYLATVIDLITRMVVGWQIADPR
ncbi:hypothetical protein [Corynebacterium cystitidis]|uniref:hypothetical protein n=1 Tax=Corynebacterium cystitidis TaxID=35757 RepID=UPI00211E736D|nr:hypothetical protein [Corynebacterium cystitidis]